jgi:hypothetical protein
MCGCEHNFTCARCLPRELDRDDEPRSPAEVRDELTNEYMCRAILPVVSR